MRPILEPCQPSWIFPKVYISAVGRAKELKFQIKNIVRTYFDTKLSMFGLAPYANVDC